MFSGLSYHYSYYQHTNDLKCTHIYHTQLKAGKSRILLSIFSVLHVGVDDCYLIQKEMACSVI